MNNSLYEARTGDIFFIVHKRNIISKLFAFVMKSKWSHCGIILGHFKDQVITCETTDFEVALKTFGIYVDDKNVEIQVYRKGSYTEQELSDMVKRGISLQGRPYPYIQLISLSVRRLLMSLGFIISNFFARKNGPTVCCGVPISVLSVTAHGIGIDPTEIDTEEFLDILVNQKKWKKVFHKAGE